MCTGFAMIPCLLCRGTGRVAAALNQTNEAPEGGADSQKLA
jgi:hypothetical protein